MVIRLLRRMANGVIPPFAASSLNVPILTRWDFPVCFAIWVWVMAADVPSMAECAQVDTDDVIIGNNFQHI